MNPILISAFVMISAALLAMVVVVLIYRRIFKEKIDDPDILHYMQKIRRGTLTYLKLQYVLVAKISFVLISILVLLHLYNPDFIPIFTPFAVLSGIFFTVLSGYVSVMIATKANGYTAYYSNQGLKKAYNFSYLAGSICGLFTHGLILFDLAAWWLIIYYASGAQAANIVVIVLAIGRVTTTFGVGSSSYSLVARVTGGTYTKGADVGGDTVGKIILDLPEDSPKNPASLADAVGDNVGDINGGFGDLYESMVAALVAATLLCAEAFIHLGLSAVAVMVPMVIASLGIPASLLGMFFSLLRNSTERKIIAANQNGLYVATLFMAVSSYFVINATIGIQYWYAVIVGLTLANVLNFIPEFFTSHRFKPVIKIARNSQTGAASSVISSMENGSRSASYAGILIGLSILACYNVIEGTVEQKLAGISIAAVSMLSLLAFILANDAQGPMTDNAQGINEMVGASKEALAVTNVLDSLGNTAAAKLKGFSIGSAAMASLVMIGAYLTLVKGAMAKYNIETPLDLSLTNPNVMAGLFIGGSVIYLFTADLLNSVATAAAALVNNVLEQVKRFMKDGEMVPGEEPDYEACVAIVTKSAQKSIVTPITIVFLSVALSGLIGGPEMIAGLLIGAAVVGILSGLFQSNTGGAADNAKKYVEAGHFGGKGSETHKATVVADTVGDPLKDTSGPSINILIKLMSMVAVVTATAVVYFYYV